MDQAKSALTEPAPQKSTHHHGDTRRNTIAEWAVTIIILLFGMTTLVQAFVIPSGSMETTLLIGDHLLVDKLAYAPSDAVGRHVLPYQDVQYGDIIVFRYPADTSQTYVKRVIGVPGDRIHLINKQVYRNGVPLNEPYVIHRDAGINEYRDFFPNAPADFQVIPRGREMLASDVVNGDVVVPPSSYFAMGDNRDQSSDSRYWGFVPRENIVGKPLIIYWSFEAPTQGLAGPTFDLDHIIFVVSHFFTNTRWDRTFKLVHGYSTK